MRQRAIPLAALALSVLLSACGNVTPSPAPTTLPTGAPSSSPGLPGDLATIRVYFGLGSSSGNPILAPVERQVSPAPPDGGRGVAMAELLAGPLPAELGASPAMFTAVPPNTDLRGLQIDAAGIATVDLSEAFEEADELPALRTALAQVVVTLTQFPEVTGVNVTINGAVLEQTDPSGHQLDRPATRADYADQLGPIFVDDPAWGATLHSPIHLAGLSDVFEAQFGFRLLDADGRSLASGQLTASCGTGCLGSYGVSVPFNVPASTAGRLQVFDLSEQDGSMQDLVDYPVTLLP